VEDNYPKHNSVFGVTVISNSEFTEVRGNNILRFKAGLHLKSYASVIKHMYSPNTFCGMESKEI
jgi:hypothetical protein